MTGTDIRTIRQRANLTRRQFAAMLNYSIAAIKKFELKDRVSKSFIAAFRIARQRYFAILSTCVV